MSSVSRYEKAGRLGKEYHLLPPETRRRLEWLVDNLERAVSLPRSVGFVF